jgi:archaemetzincin
MKLKTLLPILILFMPLLTLGQSTVKGVTVAIQPFGDIPPSYVSYFFKQASGIIPKIVIKEAIPLPKSAFYVPRGRYRADSIIDFLERNTPNGQVTIGLTIKDISCTDPRSPDWGVFGLSYCPGKACVASSFRLKGDNKMDQFFKVAIHELGHTQGLDHCPDTTCIMQDAKGHNTTAQEQGFCKGCKTKLISKGCQF